MKVVKLKFPEDGCYYILVGDIGTLKVGDIAVWEQPNGGYTIGVRSSSDDVKAAIRERYHPLIMYLRRRK